jgi:hypothetical protein
MCWWDTEWEIQVLFTVGAGLRRVCIKPERRSLGSSYPFVPFCTSVRPAVLSHVSVRLQLGDYPSNLKISTSKIGDNRTKIVDVLHIDLCTFHCCRLHRFPTKALLSNSNYFFIYWLWQAIEQRTQNTGAFPFKTWFRDNVTMSRYTYIPHFVPLLHTV